jgi:feruloyl esterase
MINALRLGAVVTLAMMFGHQAFANVRSCESLVSLSLPNTSITSAQTVSAGSFVPPVPDRLQTFPYGTLAAFCRVAATLKPSSDSDIRIEVWLPVSGWNGKFQAVGNGGLAGFISYAALASAVVAGYASASTDTGHSGNTAAFALGHPEKLIDYAYRSVHEMTVCSKLIIEAYYGDRATLSFWNGCSLGGGQGLSEAMRYPADFDGIVAGSPVLHGMIFHEARLAINLFVHQTSASYIPPEKYPMIHEAVLQACDMLDGVQDGVLEDPRRCHFNPAILACKSADGPSCLTTAQVKTARGLYAPVKNPKTGEVAFFALLQPGSELGWNALAGEEPLGLAVDAFKYIVLGDPKWDWRNFNAASDIGSAFERDNVLNFTDPNLKPFFDRGGKLLMYHGWADPQVTPLNAVNYYSDVVRTVGEDVVGKSIALYMVPGMGHCQGGPGTDTFDKMAAIEQWIVNGVSSDRIVASHATNGITDRTRPLCLYPQVARYKGVGSTNDAANFVCAHP